MVRIVVNNTDLEFPHDPPYDIQKSYMGKVLDCLDQKRHGVLESPTGTGKTLCLFSPITAWVKKKKIEELNDMKIDNKSDPDCGSMEVEEGNSQQAWDSKYQSKVWYTTRTHSQIAQAIGEVRKCNIEDLKVRVMGGRDHLCINPEVLEEKDTYIQGVKCGELRKARRCKYYENMNSKKNNIKFFETGKVMDIEDMVSAGRECHICPYYKAVHGHKGADIVLLPYNYLIDKEKRDADMIDLQDDVIVFDEGHNVPKSCEESFEFIFTNTDISLGIQNVKELINYLTFLSYNYKFDGETSLQVHISNSKLVLNILQKLEENLKNWKVSKELLPIRDLYRFLEDSGMQGEAVNQLSNAIEGFLADSIHLNLTNGVLFIFHLLERVGYIMFGDAVKSFDSTIVEKSFKWNVTIDFDRVNKPKKVSLYCFNPSIGVRALLQAEIQSIIITSGTLSPLKKFIYELGLPNPVTLENEHVAPKSQVPFVILGTGVGNVKMDASYKNRDKPEYMNSLGNTLTNLISSIPDGVLILFSSYSMMENLRKTWDSSDFNIWNRLKTIKRVFVEPRDKEEFINCMENYRRAIDSGNGAILMGVLRGKISEGLDFKDQYCRSVFIIGVPFPPISDPRVKGKESYADSLVFYDERTEREEKLYNSNTFMSVEAMKATNQAIGRLIRHKRDYGAIILVDYRFCWPRLFSNLSKWLKSEMPVEKNFPETKRLLREFFKNVHFGKLGVEEIRRQAVDENGSPIAGYIKYDECDHKGAVRTPASLITAQIAEDATPNEISTQADPRNAKGRSTIEYEDDSEEEQVSLLDPV